MLHMKSKEEESNLATRSCQGMRGGALSDNKGCRAHHNHISITLGNGLFAGKQCIDSYAKSRHFAPPGVFGVGDGLTCVTSTRSAFIPSCRLENRPIYDSLMARTAGRLVTAV